MNAPNEDHKPTDEIKLLPTQSATCGGGCGCHNSGSVGKMRRVLGIIVLVAAGILVARAAIKSNRVPAETPAVGFATTAFAEQAPAPTTSDTVAVKEIGALSELNMVATDMAGVFVFLPGKSETTVKAPMAQIRGAAQTIEPKVRGKIGMFTLKTSSPDYEWITAQLSLPGVLVFAKGKGMAPVAGEITETKLVQAYVKASSAGGCCGGGATSCK